MQNPGLLTRWRRESRQITHLALPMLIAQTAQVATGFVDTTMSGHVSTDDLAAVSIGSSLFITLYITLMGLVTALNPILSHMLGAGQQAEIGETGRQGLWFGLFCGLAGMLIMFGLQPWLHHFMPLPPQVEAKTLLFMSGAALALPAALVHRAMHAYASSLNRPKPIMIMSLLALALNIPLNYTLIHGLFGLPAMGGAGCGWATAIVFWFNAIALFCYLARHAYFKPFGLTRQFSWPRLTIQRRFLRLGTPIAMSFFVEISLFTSIALLIAPLGALTVASHQAAQNFCTILYMVPQSISNALTVRISQLLGAGRARDARFCSASGLVLGLSMASLIMLLILLFHNDIIRLYSSDPALIALGGSLLLFAAVYQLTDATQTIASGALRGYRLTRIPMLIHILAFWVLGLGLGIVLGLNNCLRASPMGVYGFWTALVISLSAAAIFLVYYLARQSRLAIATESGLTP